MPQGISLGDSVFGKSDSGLGGFLSTFRLRADAVNTVEYTDNAKLSDTNRESDISDDLHTAITAESDWDRHALRFGVSGNLKRFHDAVSENRNGFNLYSDGRIDLTDEWSLNANLNYNESDEGRDNPQEANPNLSRLRTIKNTGAGVGVDFNGYPFSVFTRSTYNHIVLEKLDGEAQGFRDRDISRTSTHIAYPLTDDIRVFVQPAYSREMYDISRDASGINRDSAAYELLGGITYNVTDLTALNFGIGELWRDFTDSRLNDASGLTIDGSLRWSPYEDFSLDLGLHRTIESTTLTGVNDIVTTSGRLVPSYAIAPDTALSAELGYDKYEFNGINGSDRDYLAGIGLNYFWNNAVNTGIRYRYRRRFSDAVDRDFYSNSILLTLSCIL